MTSEQFPHRLRVLRAGGGTGEGQDPVTGMPTGKSYDQVVYDGPADVQDAGEARPRNAAGMPTLEAEATAFLPDEAAPEDFLGIAVGDSFEVTYPDTDRTATGEVLFVRELDATLLLRFR